MEATEDCTCVCVYTAYKRAEVREEDSETQYWSWNPEADGPWKPEADCPSGYSSGIATLVVYIDL